MSSLAQELTGPPPRDLRARVCGVAKWIESQSEADQAAIKATLADTRWKGSDLYRVWIGHGFTMNQNALTMHRRGACSCAAL